MTHCIKKINLKHLNLKHFKYFSDFEVEGLGVG